MRSFRNWTATLCSPWSQRTFANSWDTKADGERSSFWARITELSAICRLWDSRAASDIRVRHCFSMSTRPEMNGVNAGPICCLCSFCLAERRREMRVATIFSRAEKLDSCSEGRTRRHSDKRTQNHHLSHQISTTNLSRAFRFSNILVGHSPVNLPGLGT